MRHKQPVVIGVFKMMMVTMAMINNETRQHMLLALPYKDVTALHDESIKSRFDVK